MEERTKFHVGLDVHKDSIAVAVAEPGRAPARRWFGKVAHDAEQAPEGAGQDRRAGAGAHRLRGWPDRLRSAARLAGQGLRLRDDCTVADPEAAG